MELKLTKDTIAIKEVTNPFKKVVTESGIYVGIEGVAQSAETGEVEVLEQIIGFGVVTIVGPDCKFINVGDGVYYDRRTPRPIPFYESVWVFNENNILGYVKDEGELQDLIKEKDAEYRREALKTTLAKNMPLGSTNLVAGEKGSGLKLIK